MNCIIGNRLSQHYLCEDSTVLCAFCHEMCYSEKDQPKISSSQTTDSVCQCQHEKSLTYKNKYFFLSIFSIIYTLSIKDLFLHKKKMK